MSPEARVFVIDVPAGETAHQARDGRYYVRSEFEIKALRDYENSPSMNRGIALSSQVTASLALRRPAERLKDEQLEDHLAQVAGLQTALSQNAQHLPGRGTSPPAPSVSTWSGTNKQTSACWSNCVRCAPTPKRATSSRSGVLHNACGPLHRRANELDLRRTLTRRAHDD